MTEWHGIKVGGLYKQTGRGSRGAPLAMVVAIEDCPGLPIGDGIQLTTIEGGKLCLSWLEYEPDMITVDGDKWPWKEVV